MAIDQMTPLGRDEPLPGTEGARSGMCPLMKALVTAEVGDHGLACNEFRFQRATADGGDGYASDEQITLQSVGRQLNSVIERINAIDRLYDRQILDRYE